MYQALYRKWRPQTFDEVVGQEHITETLKSQVKNGRLSHAYIFIGTRGTGKTTCARILARAVNCEHPVDGNPCGQCAACRGISEGTVMDVVELDAASNNGVDNVRALREEATFSPASVRRRVYIIDEVHMLSLQAFNALLKILEEPPEHLMFILATTELQKVPATILSRCQRHSFRRIETGRIAEYLETIAGREKFDLSNEAADLIARLADGGVRDALSLLDQCSAAEKIDVETVYATMGLAGNRRIAQMLDRILKRDSASVLKAFAGMWMDGKDPATLLGELNGLLRDVLMMHVAPGTAKELVSGSYENAVLAGFAERMTTEEILSAMDTLQRTMSGMRDAGNPKTAAELCLVSLCDDAAGESLSQLRARIARLEEKVERGVPVRQAEPADAEDTEDAEDEDPMLRREECWEEDPEDEIDLSAFQEEQPEDAIVKRSEEPPAAPTTVSWKEICGQARSVPVDLQAILLDEKLVRGRLDGNLLQIEVEPGFRYSRFNRQDVLASFARAASELTGREIRAQLSELKPEERPKRSLDELRAFNEVHFI